MIDTEQFAQGMALLAGAYGRQVDGPVAKLYFDALSPQLDTEEWQRAVRIVVLHEEFWPSPAVIVRYAKGAPNERSRAALDLVVATLKRYGGFRFLPVNVAQDFSPATWAGISAVGGLAAISLCTEDRWPTLAKRFREAFEDAVSPRAVPELPDTPDPRTKQLVADVAAGMTRPTAEEWKP